MEGIEDLFFVCRKAVEEEGEWKWGREDVVNIGDGTNGRT